MYFWNDKRNKTSSYKEVFFWKFFKNLNFDLMEKLEKILFYEKFGNLTIFLKKALDLTKLVEAHVKVYTIYTLIIMI
jgi:hypothetical protein